jgi:hypothetical protein
VTKGLRPLQFGNRDYFTHVKAAMHPSKRDFVAYSIPVRCVRNIEIC